MTTALLCSWGEYTGISCVWCSGDGSDYDDVVDSNSSVPDRVIRPAP